MGLKPSAETPGTSAPQINWKTNDIIETRETENSQDKNSDNSNETDDFGGDKVMKEDSILLRGGLQKGKLNEWEARRYGSMAARLLRDVKIT